MKKCSSLCSTSGGGKDNHTLSTLYLSKKMLSASFSTIRMLSAPAGLSWIRNLLVAGAQQDDVTLLERYIAIMRGGII